MFGQSILLVVVCQFLTLAAALHAESELLSQRPSIAVAPHGAFKPFPFSPARRKTCHVKSHGDGSDGSKYILGAFRKCSPGGCVVFDKDKVYTIGKTMDIRFLKWVDVVIQGKIIMSNNIDYWLANSFKYPFQDTSSFIQIGGTDVNIYSGGEIDGNGQAWWDARMDNKTIQHPILVTYIDSRGRSVSTINLCNSPNWFQLAYSSSDLVFNIMYLNASSNGWDTYRSDNIVIQNSRIFNSDGDPPPLLRERKKLTGQDGARIKIWPGAIGNSTNTGGGSGWVRNVTYDGMHNYNNDWAIELTQCYFAANQTA
ncbi:hypothetical protein CDV55_100821 [Aspergillus turcosus]|nr:hypothetical protein CDV55_100821 [Aspergillus turcosus]